MTDGRRNRGLIRCLKLRRYLDGLQRRPPLPELAERFRVTTRTIRRDLHALRAAGERLPRWKQDARDDEWYPC